MALPKYEPAAPVQLVVDNLPGPLRSEWLANIESACIKGLAFLVGNLDKASKLPSDDGGREAALLALDAVIMFLDGFPQIGRLNLHAPLRNVFAALNDLDARGVRHPMLTIAQGQGSNALPSDRAMLHAVAAAWAEALIQTGAGRDAADAKVASELRRLGYAPRGAHRTVTPGTVRQWRKEAQQTPSPGVDKEMYRQMRRAFQGMERKPLNDFIPPMLRNILPHLFSPPVHLGEKG